MRFILLAIVALFGFVVYKLNRSYPDDVSLLLASIGVGLMFASFYFVVVMYGI